MRDGGTMYMVKNFIVKNLEGEKCITSLEVAIDLISERLQTLPGGYYEINLSIEQLNELVD